MLSARASMYPDCLLSENGQIYHFKVQIATENNFRKAMKTMKVLNLDLG